MANGKHVDVVTDDRIVAGNVDTLSRPDELNTVTSYAEAMQFLGLDSLSSEEASEFLEWDTNPFELVEKDRLVGVPLLIVQWRFVEGDFGSFVVVSAIARMGNGTDWPVMFTDGSPTGVCGQLAELTRSRITKGLTGREQKGALVRSGLRRSEYDTEVSGEVVHGVTFYLNNAPVKS